LSGAPGLNQIWNCCLAEGSAATGAAAAPFVTVKRILVTSCSACHPWTGSWQSITADGRVVPGDPGSSRIYQTILDNTMPPAADPLTGDQKGVIRDWIASGAPATDLQAAGSTSDAAATSPADTAAAPAASSSRGFLLFPDKVTFHKVTGFTSTALLTGAGVLGAVHFVNMMKAGHDYRDAIGFHEEDPDPVRAPWVTRAWGDDAALRWWHVGLLVSGEALYLGDALTGISLMTRKKPGRLTRNDIHRYAFYTHAALMGAQLVLGFLTTDALSRGDHETVIGLGAAHAAIGVAIPLVMLGAGLENLLLPR
jgi:hypothetical protein